jgi:hypothetical protein
MSQSSIATLLSPPDRIPRQMFLPSACDRSSGLCFSKDPTPAAGRREAPRWQDGPPATVDQAARPAGCSHKCRRRGDDFFQPMRGRQQKRFLRANLRFIHLVNSVLVDSRRAGISSTSLMAGSAGCLEGVSPSARRAPSQAAFNLSRCRIIQSSRKRGNSWLTTTYAPGSQLWNEPAS